MHHFDLPSNVLGVLLTNNPGLGQALAGVELASGLLAHQGHRAKGTLAYMQGRDMQGGEHAQRGMRGGSCLSRGGLGCIDCNAWPSRPHKRSHMHAPSKRHTALAADDEANNGMLRGALMVQHAPNSRTRLKESKSRPLHPSPQQSKPLGTLNLKHLSYIERHWQKRGKKNYERPSSCTYSAQECRMFSPGISNRSQGSSKLQWPSSFT